MHLSNPVLGRNITYVPPPYFIISGFVGIPDIKYYYFFLFFVYIVSVLGNTAVMTVIYLDHNLRAPKYIAVFNLALVDLFGSTALVPKILDISLFNHHYIPYNDCFVFLFFCYTCLSMQALNLVVLSYDRLMAIIFPLHYPLRLTHKFMLSLIVCLWVFVIFVMLITVGLLTSLSYCGSVVINSYFCDYGKIARLACNNRIATLVLGNLLPVLILWFPLIFILSSYACIGYALSKVTTVQERIKAFKTCTAHVLLVAIYFLPVLISFSLRENLQPNARILNLSLTSIVPPMLNPIIYVLQTREIKESVKRIFKVRKRTRITVKKEVLQ